MIGLESSGSRMANLARQQMYFGRFFDVDEITAEIEAVTPDDVQALAQRMFRPEALALTLLGNLGSMKIEREDAGLLIKFCSMEGIMDCRGMMKTMKFGQRTAAQYGAFDEEGFTLIELLIVMSVMLILMTLALPQMLKFRKQAQETSAIQSVRTIGQAQLQYNSQYPAEWVLPARWRRWGRSEVGCADGSERAAD